MGFCGVIREYNHINSVLIDITNEFAESSTAAGHPSREDVAGARLRGKPG